MRSGVIRLFRFAGIDVFLHFSWFLVAAIYISGYIRRYESPVWGVLEYISVFVTNRIVLWPLGGIAFVDPPRRPGAYLWSIAAGPLVNVILLPVLAFVSMLAQASLPGSDVAVFFRDLNFINAVLLGFNLLPVFPLDGQCHWSRRRSHSRDRGINGRVGMVGRVGVFPFKPCLVRLAASQSDDRCVKNGNSNFTFAHGSRKSGPALGHPERKSRDPVALP